MGENGSPGTVKVRVVTQKVEFHIFEHEKVHFGFIFSHNDDLIFPSHLSSVAQFVWE